MCSFYKRTLDPMTRFKYLQHAYEGMKQWIQAGQDEHVLALKKYVHRHFRLPSTIHGSIAPEDAQDLLNAFGYHYIDALLTYCSDDLKSGLISEYFYMLIMIVDLIL